MPKIYSLLGILIFPMTLIHQWDVRETQMLVFGLYIVSVAVLLFGGLFQLYFKSRRAAIITFLFAIADIFIVYLLMPYFFTVYEPVAWHRSGANADCPLSLWTV